MKKVKNTNKIMKKACNISAIFGAGLVVLSIGSMCFISNQTTNLNGELMNKKYEIIASSSFNEYIQAKYKSLYQEYLNGEMSSEEYSNEIEDIIDSDNILSGNHEAVDEKLNDEVSNLNNEIRMNDALFVTAVVGLSAGVAGIVGGVTSMPITKENGLEM